MEGVKSLRRGYRVGARGLSGEVESEGGGERGLGGGGEVLVSCAGGVRCLELQELRVGAGKGGEQSSAAARDDTFFDGCARCRQRIFEAGFLLVHLDLS